MYNGVHMVWPYTCTLTVMAVYMYINCNGCIHVHVIRYTLIVMAVYMYML